jgi:hypothetical protein
MGALSDRIGAKKVTLICMAASVACLVIMTLVDSFGMALVGVILLATGLPMTALTIPLLGMSLFGYRAQEELDGGEAAVCEPASELALARQVAQSGDGQDLTEFYLSLEILTPRWAALLRQSAEPMGWVEELRAMARYGVERYWLQAVSDYDLVCRVKMIVAACLLVRQLGGNVLETAQLYSKEIENSGENVDAILDAAYTHPALTDANLLCLLALN